MLPSGWPAKGLLTSNSRLKFLADEDVDARLVRSLSSKGVNIKYASKGAKNSELYALACKEKRALFTLDKDFLNTSLFPPSKLPAIIVLRVHPPEVSKLESLLLKFIKEFSDEMKGRTFVLKDKGVESAD